MPVDPARISVDGSRAVPAQSESAPHSQTRKRGKSSASVRKTVRVDTPAPYPNPSALHADRDDRRQVFAGQRDPGRAESQAQSLRETDVERDLHDHIDRTFWRTGKKVFIRECQKTGSGHVLTVMQNLDEQGIMAECKRQLNWLKWIRGARERQARAGSSNPGPSATVASQGAAVPLPTPAQPGPSRGTDAPPTYEQAMMQMYGTVPDQFAGHMHVGMLYSDVGLAPQQYHSGTGPADNVPPAPAAAIQPWPTGM
ncbi:hypothetical protein [Martelella sp. HB161492]|uniref:hypothetical protein n=1 Tax=Martelella sp. HB161492 TaxID=2720726 RepID=UPI0015911D67|nr:hypothetical protein [Martelella sp. HB161492]